MLQLIKFLDENELFSIYLFWNLSNFKGFELSTTWIIEERFADGIYPWQIIDYFFKPTYFFKLVERNVKMTLSREKRYKSW